MPPASRGIDATGKGSLTPMERHSIVELPSRGTFGQGPMNITHNGHTYRVYTESECLKLLAELKASPFAA